MSRSFCRSERRPSRLSSMVRSFLLLTFLAASAFAEENDAATRISAIEARIGGRIGVAALDATNTEHIDYRADEPFPMTSVIQQRRRRFVRTCKGCCLATLYQKHRATSSRIGYSIMKPEGQ